ncbi:MAG: lipid A deacylase LpxR family protein [Flavobacterium sp.]
MRFKFSLLLLVPMLFYPQQKPNFEIGLQVDNDSFVSTYNDFYYTAGTFIFANSLSKKSTEDKKIIYGFKVGQQIFNPRYVKSPYPEDHNRPYAGYLFGEYSQTKMYRSNQVFGFSLRLGVVGPNSKAEQFQDWMHSTFGFGEIIGWEYQIHNLLAVQFGANYSKPIFSKISNDKIDFHLCTDAEIGTAFTGMDVGTLGRISLSKSIVPMQQSNYYNGLGSSRKELYFFVLPKINLRLYDATIQGSLFNDDSPVTFNLKPIRFKGEAGLKFKYNRYNLSCIFRYTTDEIKGNSAAGYYYGSLSGSYQF